MRALPITLANPINRAAVAMIDLYRRRISPRKGYGCPHRLLHGGESCSAAARRLYLTLDPLTATRRTIAQLWECRDASFLLACKHSEGATIPPGLLHDRRRRGQCCIVIPLPACSTTRMR